MCKLSLCTCMHSSECIWPSSPFYSLMHVQIMWHFCKYISFYLCLINKICFCNKKSCSHVHTNKATQPLCCFEHIWCVMTYIFYIHHLHFPFIYHTLFVISLLTHFAFFFAFTFAEVVWYLAVGVHRLHSGSAELSQVRGGGANIHHLCYFHTLVQLDGSL